MKTSEQRPIQAIRFRMAFVGIAIGRGLVVGAVGLALVVGGSCKKPDRVTHIYGVVTDTNAEPVEGVKILIMGYRTLSLARLDELKHVFTDKEGKYSVTVEPGKRHSSVDVVNQYFNDDKLNANYESYISTKNGQHITHCCPADIGQKTEYNFTLLPR